MAHPPRSIDVRSLPDLRKVAEEVRATNEPCILRVEGEEIAVVMPVQAKKKRQSVKKSMPDTAFEAFRAALGGWRDVDTDRLLADIYADRDRGDRPPVGL